MAENNRDLCALCGHFRMMHPHPEVEPEGWCCKCPGFVTLEKTPIADEIRKTTANNQLHPLVKDNHASPRGLCNASTHHPTFKEVRLCTLDYGHTGCHINGGLSWFSDSPMNIAFYPSQGLIYLKGDTQLLSHEAAVIIEGSQVTKNRYGHSPVTITDDAVRQLPFMTLAQIEEFFSKL